jgi:hypothetical protein
MIESDGLMSPEVSITCPPAVITEPVGTGSFPCRWHSRRLGRLKLRVTSCGFLQSYSYSGQYLVISRIAAWDKHASRRMHRLNVTGLHMTDGISEHQL